MFGYPAKLRANPASVRNVRVLIGIDRDGKQTLERLLNMKRFRVVFREGDNAVVVTARRFEWNNLNGEIEFFGDDDKKIDDIYVAWKEVAAVVPIEIQEPQGSHSMSTFR
jgi:hypothetical protein